MSDNAKSTPVFAVDEFWPITGAVWENVDGEGRLTFSYTVKRSYFDQASQEYRSTHSMFDSHAMAHKAVIDALWSWLATEGRTRIREQQKTTTTDDGRADTTDPHPPRGG